jgi:hypothetical protein
MAAAKKTSNTKAPAGKGISTRATTTDLALLDSELANEIADIKSMVGQTSGNKIKLEASGDYVLPSGENLGNEIQVVVLDFVSKNQWYPNPFNPNVIVPPDCYAIGKVLSQMAPEGDSPNMQGGADGDCATCPLNQFGSGNGGQSKACKNSRLAAVLVIDPNDPEASTAPDAPIYTIEFSPTSLKAFDGMVTGTARTLNGPPIKAIWTLSARNAGTYALQTFSDPLPNDMLGAHIHRRSETVDMLNRKPDFSQKPAAAGNNRRGGAGRQAAPRRGAATQARR